MPCFARSRYVAARSWFWKTLPTAGASPPGRYSLLVELNAAKRSLLSRVCWRKVWVDDEAAGRHLDGRLEGIAKAQRTPPVQGALPGGRGAGDAYGDAARDEFGREVVRLAGRGVDERVVRHRRRCGLAPVDGADLAGLRVVEHEVASAADPGTVRLGHAQRRGCGDGGVRCVAALAEDLDRGSGCFRVYGADRAAVSGGGGGLFSLARIGMGGVGDDAARHAQCQGRRDGHQPTCHICHDRSRVVVMRVDSGCHATMPDCDTQYLDPR